MADVPPIFNTAFEACVNPPVPASAVPTVNVLLFVNVTLAPVTVKLGMEIVPVNACVTLKVCTPVLAVNVPLLVMPPLKVTAEAADSVQAPPGMPALMVTKPAKVFVPVVAERFNVPSMVVVPLTVRVCPTFRVEPLAMYKLAQAAAAAEMVTVFPPSI